MVDPRNATEDTAKGRAQRIRLDYYRHRGPLYWWRWGLAAVALLSVGGYAAFVLLGNRRATHLSTGPLALAHATFEQDCTKCHQPLTPIAADAWNPRPQRAVASLEAACRTCHAVDGHHRSSLSDSGKRLDSHCSLCHREHQGREHRLVPDHDDAACTQCHGDLEPARRSGSIDSDIQSFTAASHGEFASLKEDPGRIRFDHAQHLHAGQVEPGRRGGFRVDMLAPADAHRYRREGQSDQDLVQLTCASCHEFKGATEFNAADYELGRYPAPVTFARHCAACHSLTYRGQTADQLPLPHAAPWEEMATLLSAKTAAGRLRGEIRMPRDAVRPLPVPGTPSDTAEAIAPAAQLIDGEIELAMEHVRARCLQCHVESDVTSSAIAAAAKPDHPPMIPERWLRRGLFDHAAHPDLHCAFCHAEAYAEIPDEFPDGLRAMGAEPKPRDSQSGSGRPHAALDDQQVMIRGIASCTPCHRGIDEPFPDGLSDVVAAGFLGRTSSWASASCTTCHRYHWSRPDNRAPIPTRKSVVVAP